MSERQQCLESVAHEVYILGFPMVAGHQTLVSYAKQNAAIKDQVAIQPMGGTPGVHDVHDNAPLRQNAHPTCSFMWLDLRTEPMVLSIGSQERTQCYSIQIMDLDMNRIGYVGPRASDQGTALFLVARSDWQGEVPPRINSVFRSDTSIVQLIYRTQSRHSEGRRQDAAPSASSFVHPLSTFLKQPAPPQAAEIEWPTHDLDADDPQDFFLHLDFLLRFSPAHVEERQAMARLTKMSVRPGSRFHPTAMSSFSRQLLREGVQSGTQAILDELQRVTSVKDLFGRNTRFRRNSLQKAAAAKVGIYGQSESEAYYLPHYGTESEPTFATLPLFYRSRMGTMPLSCGVDPECSVRNSYRVALPRATGSAMAEAIQYDHGTVAGQIRPRELRAEHSDARGRAANRNAGQKSDRTIRNPLRAEHSNIRIIQRICLDSEGRPLVGNRQYVLHFAQHQLPPVNDFWSIATYDDKGLVIRSSLAHRVTGDQTPLRLQPDGSLDLYFQGDTPGAGCELNWVPVQPGPFHIVLNLYAPRPEILTGAWTAPLPLRVS